MAEVDRALVIRQGALGDFVFLLPVLQALRERFPRAWIEYLGNQEAGRLAQGVYVDRVCPEPPGYHLLFTDGPVPDGLRRWLSSFDLVVAYTRSAWLARSLRRLCPRVVVADPLPRDRHACEHLLEPLGRLGIDGPREPCLPLRGRPHGMVVLHPGSGSPRKCWGAEGFAELARRLGRRALLLEGPADGEAVGRVRELAPGVRVFRGSLEEVAGLLAGALGVVGNDSGISHLAAALGVPTLAIFGPTDPARWAPRGPRVRVVRAPRGRLDLLGAEVVWEALRAELARGHGAPGSLQEVRP